MSLLDKLDTSILSRSFNDKMNMDILSRPISEELNKTSPDSGVDNSEISISENINSSDFKKEEIIPIPNEEAVVEDVSWGESKCSSETEEKITVKDVEKEETIKAGEIKSEEIIAVKEEEPVVVIQLEEEPVISSGTTNEGAIINGVKWATCNVDAPGTFAGNPEKFGKFYQWNSQKAWETTGNAAEFNNTSSKSDTWKKAKDPSPAGWRIPTVEEIKMLFDASKVISAWTTENGVAGAKFTDKATGDSIFLPAAGYLSSTGEVKNAGAYCDYWSCTPSYDATRAYNLHGDKIRCGVYGTECVEGRSVRCVARKG